MPGLLQCAEPAGDLFRDIHVSDCKEDHIAKRVECAKSAGAVLDDLDDAVEAFGDGVGKSCVHECEDAEEVLAKRSDELPQWFKAASERRRRPAFKEAFGSPGCTVFPERLELVLEPPGSVDAVVGLLQRLERPGILPSPPWSVSMSGGRGASEAL